MKKKRILAVCVLLVLALLSAGCGSAVSQSTGAYDKSAGAGFAEMASDDAASVQNSSAATAGSESADAAAGGESKLIYTAQLSMETTDFDSASAGLEALAQQLGGYLQSSDVESDGNGYRYGRFTVRVPAKQFDAFCAQAGGLCHLTGKSTNVEDVSEYYYDTAGRLKTQQTKLERLQTLLEKADRMEDIITIESAISDTEAEIESLSGELQHYDRLVDHATVDLDLSEVYRLSNTEEPAAGFADRVKTALSSGWQVFLNALQGAAVALAYGWVWILLLAAGAGIAAFAVRRKKKNAAADRPKRDGDRPGNP